MQKIDSRGHYSLNLPERVQWHSSNLRIFTLRVCFFPSENKRKLMLPCKLFVSDVKEEHC